MRTFFCNNCDSDHPGDRVWDGCPNWMSNWDRAVAEAFAGRPK